MTKNMRKSKNFPHHFPPSVRKQQLTVNMPYMDPMGLTNLGIVIISKCLCTVMPKTLLGGSSQLVSR